MAGNKRYYPTSVKQNEQLSILGKEKKIKVKKLSLKYFFLKKGKVKVNLFKTKPIIDMSISNLIFQT